jgi:N-acetylmuramoyl-L-alanine amidase
MKKALLVPVLLLLFWSSGEATKRVTVEGFRYWSSERYTRVVIDLDGSTRFSQNRLSNPDRLYFDLENCFLSKKATPSVAIEDGILKRVRAGQFNKETVRVVLDLQEVESFNVFMLEEPSRLVIDVFGKKGIITIPDKEREGRLTEIKRVVIDPGHGGKDPGAIGPNGLMEKDVVLAIAKKLGGVLREKYNIEVIFTRDRDVFVPLEERAAIANSKNAELFISIHANASPRKSVRGIETYILNWTTDEEAMRVAARENAISFSRMQKAQSELQMILQDLARDNKKDESMRLAHNVQVSMVDALKQDYNEIVDLGVKQALFYVLVGAEMPSILIEASFISNYAEEKLLSQDRYREKIAEAIANGIKDYSTSSKFVKKVSDNI